MEYEDIILKCIEYIELNIKKELSIKNIANEIGYSEFHFSRIFKQKMGLSIMDYVKERRLILASKELLNGRKITDVSMDYGYETHSGFSKAFKKKFGFTPSDHIAYAISILEYLKNENGADAGMDNKLENANVFITSPVDFTDYNVLYNQLKNNIKDRFSQIDLDMIDKAYNIALKVHCYSYRKSNEPYITHPLNVALILSELESDKEMIIVGILHDIFEEDTDITLEEIEEIFSKEIRNLLEKVINFNKFNKEDFEKLLDDTNILDGRAFVIKLADRLHNMRTIKYMNEDSYKEKSRETIEIFSPIAKKLNMLKLKIELDDLAIKYIVDTK